MDCDCHTDTLLSLNKIKSKLLTQTTWIVTVTQTHCTVQCQWCTHALISPTMIWLSLSVYICKDPIACIAYSSIINVRSIQRTYIGLLQLHLLYSDIVIDLQL